MTKTENDPHEAFRVENAKTVAGYAGDLAWQEVSRDWLNLAFRRRYMYNFEWMGRPIIQIPVDMVAMQELIWDVKPDLIIETGIAHGGSLIFAASQLAQLDMVEAIETDGVFDPNQTKRRVLGIDIDIRAHNREAIETHPMAHRIDMIEGSSIDQATVDQVKDYAAEYDRVLICLDSNHTHDHVVAELELYAPLTSKGSYCIAFDSVVEDLPDDLFPDRPWSKGNNPKTAIHAFLKTLENTEVKAADGDVLKLEIDQQRQDKLMLSVAPDGFLRRI